MMDKAKEPMTEAKTRGAGKRSDRAARPPGYVLWRARSRSYMVRSGLSKGAVSFSAIQFTVLRISVDRFPNSRLQLRGVHGTLYRICL